MKRQDTNYATRRELRRVCKEPMLQMMARVSLCALSKVKTTGGYGVFKNRWKEVVNVRRNQPGRPGSGISSDDAKPV